MCLGYLKKVWIDLSQRHLLVGSISQYDLRILLLLFLSSFHTVFQSQDLSLGSGSKILYYFARFVFRLGGYTWLIKFEINVLLSVGSLNFSLSFWAMIYENFWINEVLVFFWQEWILHREERMRSGFGNSIWY